jgi:hypothetical protein
MSWLRAVWRLAPFLVAFVSRVFNVVFFKGDPYQTFSARCHMEAPNSAKWDRRRRFVNKVYFWQTDHCRQARKDEIDRALRTLEMILSEPDALNALSKII